MRSESRFSSLLTHAALRTFGDVHEFVKLWFAQAIAAQNVQVIRLPTALHGRMASDDKQAVMDQFRAAELDVLIATTVIEVGVDVPNATVMVILDADRFGIAQLHQLRGRVGRGGAKGYCVLVATSELTPDAQARLEAMVRTADGFELAEVDLDLRGEGTVMGERQKGRNDLQLASLRRDRDWVEKARAVAIEIVGDGTGLEQHPLLGSELALVLDDQDREFLHKS